MGYVDGFVRGNLKFESDLQREQIRASAKMTKISREEAFLNVIIFQFWLYNHLLWKMPFGSSTKTVSRWHSEAFDFVHHNTDRQCLGTNGFKQGMNVIYKFEGPFPNSRCDHSRKKLIIPGGGFSRVRSSNRCWSGCPSMQLVVFSQRPGIILKKISFKWNCATPCAAQIVILKGNSAFILQETSYF